MKLPEKFQENMQKLLGEGYKNYLFCLNEPAKRGIRLNQTFKVERLEEFLPCKIKKLDGLENCYEVMDENKIGHTLAHHLGLVYGQEPSSMLAALALDAKEGDRVLDLCSAPGGKAGQILERDKTGVVVLNEYVHGRANVLLSNIERQGFKNAIITSTSTERLCKVFGGYFDKILVDAPCSGEGMFRKDPATIGEWKEGINAFNHERQVEILLAAEKMLKVGGELVYSTCTFSPEENEESVQELLKTGRFKILDLPKNIQRYVRPGLKEYGADFEKVGRVYPQDGFGEGQFVAKLIKIAADEEEFCSKTYKNTYKLSQNELKNAKMLTKECVNSEKFEFYRVGKAVFAYDGPELNLPELVSMGARVGTIVKDRLVPEHQFFKCYGEQFVKRLDLTPTDPRVAKYIHGEEIECQYSSGYVCVLVGGVPLGGGKAVNGRLKNYYPKGLRD